MKLATHSGKLPGRVWMALATMLVTWTLGGCAHMAEPSTPEELVAARAKQRWDLLIKGDLDGAYQYLSPGYRQAMSLESFKGSFGGAALWKNAEVFSVICDDAERCTARMRVDAQTVLAGKPGAMVTTYANELWIHDKDNWWIYQK